MTAFDRQQIIEDAARTIHDDACLYYHDRDEEPPGCHIDIARRDAAIALPVIVAAALKPIRDRHGVPHWCMDDEGRSDCYHPDGPGMSWPCPTARLCDEIEAAAKGGE